MLDLIELQHDVIPVKRSGLLEVVDESLCLDVDLVDLLLLVEH